MLDIKPQVVAALETIGRPVIYELFVDSSTSAPCITYIEYQNQDNKTGDTFGYSNIGITVSVWANTVEDMTTDAQAVDTVMRNLGFKRMTSNEVVINNLLRKVIDYKCLGRETY